MLASCDTKDMKPVCEHPSYCRNDKRSIYIGQHTHISYSPYRNINSWFPSGWSSVRAKFRHMCFYGPYGNQQGALCNFPSNSHQWQSLYQHARNDGQYKNRFLCAARAKDAKYKGGP